jgi:hypothetical protein
MFVFQFSQIRPRLHIHLQGVRQVRTRKWDSRCLQCPHREDTEIIPHKEDILPQALIHNLLGHILLLIQHLGVTHH